MHEKDSQCFNYKHSNMVCHNIYISLFTQPMINANTQISCIHLLDVWDGKHLVRRRLSHTEAKKNMDTHCERNIHGLLLSKEVLLNVMLNIISLPSFINLHICIKAGGEVCLPRLSWFQLCCVVQQQPLAATLELLSCRAFNWASLFRGQIWGVVSKANWIPVNLDNFGLFRFRQEAVDYADNSG